MVRLRILAVGRLKEPHWRDAAAEYVKRLGRYAAVEVVEVPDSDISRDAAKAMETEADAILRALPEDGLAVALDVGGAERTSEGLAQWLDARMTGGESRVTFVLGGSAGLSPRVLARCPERLSLSRMTLPHQLARVVLLEQVYRAFRIMRGEPYHL